MCRSYLNAINASPNSPPTIWTPPSGILRPLKNWRMSNALADHAKFCSLIMTLIFEGRSTFVSVTEPRGNEIKRQKEEISSMDQIYVTMRLCRKVVRHWRLDQLLRMFDKYFRYTHAYIYKKKVKFFLEICLYSFSHYIEIIFFLYYIEFDKVNTFIVIFIHYIRINDTVYFYDF